MNYRLQITTIFWVSKLEISWKLAKKRGLWKCFGPNLGFYTKNSSQNSWSSHFTITSWNLKSRNVRTLCSLLNYNFLLKILFCNYLVLLQTIASARFFPGWQLEKSWVSYFHNQKKNQVSTLEKSGPVGTLEKSGCTQ